MFQLPHFFAQHSRRIIAIGAITLSLLAAFALAGASQNTSSIWAAAHQLAPGATLHESDLIQVNASLGTNSKYYYPSTSRLIGNVLTRTVGSGEFIPLNALAQASSATDLRQLPLGIERSDLPPDLMAGERVDLYAQPKDPGQSAELVASGIHIQSVDNKSRDLGGAVTVLFLLHDRDVLGVIDALASNRIVVVRDAL